MDYFELVRVLDHADHKACEQQQAGVATGFEPAITHHADPLKVLAALTTAIPVKQPKLHQ